jgi:hypothetical protein
LPSVLYEWLEDVLDSHEKDLAVTHPILPNPVRAFRYSSFRVYNFITDLSTHSCRTM